MANDKRQGQGAPVALAGAPDGKQRASHASAGHASASLSSPDISGSSQRLQRATRESLETLGNALSRTKLSPVPHSNRRGVSEKSSFMQTQHTQPWWESVLPPGQLAERLRRAQTSASSSRQPTPSSSSRASPSTHPTTPNGELADDHFSSNSRPGTQQRASLQASSHRRDSAKRSPKMRSMTTLAPPAPASQSFRTEGHRALSQPTSTRSSFSYSDIASAISSSGSEDSPPSMRSPSLLPEEWTSKHSVGLTASNSTGSISRFSNLGPASGNHTSSSSSHVCRSTSSRRLRVLSEDGHGLGLGLSLSRENSGHSSSAADDQFRQWQAEQPFRRGSDRATKTFPSVPQPRAHHPTLRAFSRSQSGYAFAKTFEDTPEVSSEEEHEEVLKTYHDPGDSRQASRRGSRDTDAESMPRRSSLRCTTSEKTEGSAEQVQPSRHVSFFPPTELGKGIDAGKYSMSLGRSKGRSTSNKSSQYYHEVKSSTSRSDTGHGKSAFSTVRFPGTSWEDDTFLHARSDLRGKRMPSKSAPTSPHQTFRPIRGDHKGFVTGRTSRAGPSNSNVPHAGAQQLGQTSPSLGGELETSSAEMAILSSLSVAQAQFASARNLAGALTRQLSAPLRPMLHVTLFLSISSMAFFGLIGFLVAGYLATAWDDVTSHGKALQRNLDVARKGVGSRVRRTRQALAFTLSFASGECDNGRAGQSSKFARDASDEGEKNIDSNATTTTLPAFWRVALALPTAFAQAVTPSGVVNIMAAHNDDSQTEKEKRRQRNCASTSKSPKEDDTASPASKSHGNKGSKRESHFNTMPPRPPLSSLLPSIALTLVIALGAGLASFFANRAAESTATSSASSRSSSSTVPGPRASTVHERGHVSSGIRSMGSSPTLHGRSSSLYTGKDAGVETLPRSFRQNQRRVHSTFGPATASVSSLFENERGVGDKDMRLGVSADDGYARVSPHFSPRHSPANSGRQSPSSFLGASSPSL